MLVQGRVHSKRSPRRLTGKIECILGGLNFAQDAHKHRVADEGGSQVVACLQLVLRYRAPVRIHRILAAIEIVIVYICGGAILAGSNSQVVHQLKVRRNFVIPNNDTAIIPRVFDKWQGSNRGNGEHVIELDQGNVVPFERPKIWMDNNAGDCVVELERAVFVGEVSRGHVNLRVVGGGTGS